MTQIPYKILKAHVRDRIESGDWRPGDPIPSENELAQLFGVSRMTVNRAMRELAEEKLLRRVPGIGTFVAEAPPQSDLLEIRNIADEIRGRGHAHRAEVLRLEVIAAPAGVALAFDLIPGAKIYHSLILHLESGTPIQLEDRFVNPAIAPGYLDQDFTRTTPNEFLIEVAPLQQVEHIVQAIIPEPDIRTALKLDESEACLLLTRRTWAHGQIASTARLYHPGSRFRLGGRFAPKHGAAILPFDDRDRRIDAGTARHG